MTNFSKKLFLNIGISLTALIILSGLLVYIISDFRAIGESMQKANDLATIQRANISSLNILQQGAERANIIINKLSNALPPRTLLFAFSEDMNRLAREKDLASSFTFGSETVSTTPDSPSSIVFTMTLSGERLSILAFLNALENSQYFTRITRMELLAEAGRATYQATLSGEIFFNQ